MSVTCKITHLLVYFILDSFNNMKPNRNLPVPHLLHAARKQMPPPPQVASVRTTKHKYLHVYTHVYTHTTTCMSIHMSTHTHTPACLYTCLHTHKHLHVYAHVYTQHARACSIRCLRSLMSCFLVL